MFSRPFLPCLSVLVLSLLAACGRPGGPAAAPQSAGDYFALAVGARTVRVQVAVRPEEVQRGLMYRERLGRDEGMLFVFAHPQPMGFWMRHTEIPLDIGYFDASGVLKEIYPMHPHDERTVTSRSRSLQYCLEMNQGWFQERGIKPGDRLDLAAVAAALQARGFLPTAYGLH